MHKLKNRISSSKEEIYETDNLIGSNNSDSKLNDSEYETALTTIGFGRFHWILLFLCSLANASDAIEILCVSFVLPSAQCDLKMSTADKGYLSSMTFAGMMIGGYLWGTLSDLKGRKYTLISALFFNSFFAILCGLSQTFSMLLLFRFFSGLGVGGSVPVVWSYFSEFIPKKIRGRMMCCLASSWFFGNLLVILFAYVILNHADINVNWFSGFIIINNWRFFMIVCSFPSIVTGFGLFFLPESPKFCLYNNQEFKARKILRNIYIFNKPSKNAGDLEKRKAAFELFDDIKSAKSNNIIRAIKDEESNVESDRTKNCSNMTYICFHFKKGSIEAVKTTIDLFKPPLTFRIFMVSFIMFALCFGYYGLWMWLPELFKRMKLYGGSPCSTNINKTIIINETLNCHIDDSVYLSSFYSSLSNLPGNIFTIIFVDKLGRNIITSVSLISSGLSVFGIPFVQNENQGVILTTIFGGINVITFNSFGCSTTELFPTRLRSTALGVQFVAGRLGAIMGNVLFGLAIDLSCYIPLFTISSLLILSGLLSLKLPESSKIDIN